MLLGYVVGFPVLAIVAVWRLHRRSVFKKKHIQDCAGHKTWGIMYGSFREKTWWWEITVAARKIIVASIGVFGARLDRMQVHLTLILVFSIILLTAVVKPYGSNMLNWLEIGSLSALYATLWAASIFLTYPHCESEGKSVLWCEFLAVLVGLADVLVTLLFVILFLRAKGEAKLKCLDACFTLRTGVQRASLKFKRSLSSMGIKRRQSQGENIGNQQERIRGDTVHVIDGSVQHYTNPLGNIYTANQDRSELEMPKMRKFKEYESEEGKVFYVDVDSDESVWDLPRDGVLVED